MVKRVRGCCGCEAHNTANCVSCPERESVELICDFCGNDEVEKLYWYGDSQICEDCLLAEFDEVEVDQDGTYGEF